MRSLHPSRVAQAESCVVKPDVGMPAASTVSRRACLTAAGAWPLALTLVPLASTAAAASSRARGRLFGSHVELIVPDLGDRGAAARVDGVEAAWLDLAGIHRRWNAWKPGEVSRVNEALRRGRRAEASADLIAMLRDCVALEAASQGCFNPAIGGLVGRWGFHHDELRDGPEPSLAQVDTWRRAAPSLAHLRIDERSITSHNPRVQLDVGAVAKGVAIERALAILRRHGVHDALLDLGGNVATMGRHDGRPWRIAIRDPHGSVDAVLATIDTDGSTDGEAVVTSGIYERQRRAGGKLVSHVIDPRSGRSARALAGVTVVARSAAFADAAATAALVAGPRWVQVARRMGADQVLVVDAQGRVDATPAMWRRLRRA